MTTTSHHPDDHLLVMLADRALGEIDEHDEAELRSLLVDERVEREAVSMDAAAAALNVALAAAVVEPVPSRLRDRLDRAASQWLDGEGAAPVYEPDFQAHSGAAQPIPLPASMGTTPRGSRSMVAAWSGWLAAAACLILALIAWTQGAPQRSIEASAAEGYAEMTQQPGVIRVGWAKQKDDPLLDADRVGGDVVWDPVAQKGYMRIDGLKANDPSNAQYQLWVFDGTRDAAHPVDGGVFNITKTEGGEAIVEFTPRIPVREATLFAVTVEEPGGVVVSSRERLPIAAPVSEG